VDVLLFKFKYKVFYRNQWLKGVEIANYLLKVVRDQIVSVSLKGEVT